MVRGAFAAFCFVLVVFGMAGFACGQNDELLRSLPRFPGSEEIDWRTYDDDLGTEYLKVTFRTPSGTANSDIVDFYVARMKDEWCYKTLSGYHYEAEEYLIDAQGLEAVFQTRDSTVLLSTHRARQGGEVFTLNMGPTYDRDPDIDDCDR